MRRRTRALRLRLQALGLRWKIAALLAAGCSLVAVTIGVLIHQARTAQVAEQARSGALEQLYAVRRLYEVTGQLDPEKDGEARAAIDGPGVPAELRAAALAGRRTTYLRMCGAEPAVWAARPVGGAHVLSVRLPLAAEREELAELDRQLVGYGAAVVGLAALGGAALASRLSRDLRSAAETARRISGGELDARIDRSGPPGSRNEVAELSHAVDTMAATLQERLEAEQRFTADVAHELRTPLTGLHTAAELLPGGRPTELVRDRVAALRTLTEDLLEVARLDADRERPDLAVHPLEPLVAALVARSGVPVRFAAEPGDRPGTGPVRGPVRESGLESGLESGRERGRAPLREPAAPDSAAEPAGAGRTGPARGDTAEAAVTLVRTDGRRLERILTNLLGNARRHGGDPVVIAVSGHTVTVSDHGPGFPEKLLRDGPQRFLTGAAERGRGTGLGLTIALGQAQVIGARLTLSNPPEGGARATLELPPA
ncbi:HAMP domain-containing sensor histidine kinase [Streptomyces sp. NPDC097619]|uniref:sensor histidine kinase n=1 Tax=Streptomyces sp. NPDC097619 TaxID=3157228 RepID=UPI003324A2AA